MTVGATVGTPMVWEGGTVPVKVLTDVPVAVELLEVDVEEG